MSIPSVTGDRNPASVNPNAEVASTATATGQFQGSATEVVSSRSKEARPGAQTAANISAWKLGEKGNSASRLLHNLKTYAEAAKQQALNRQGATGKDAGKAKSAKKSLLGIFKNKSPGKATAAPASAGSGSRKERIEALAGNDRVILRDPEASILINQAGSILNNANVVPRAREIMEKTGNREELTDFFLQQLDIRNGGQKRHFRNIATALTDAACIAETPNGAQRIIAAGHPDMDPARQAKFAQRIDLAALLLSRLQDVSYVPARPQMQQLVKDGNFKNFGDTKMNNPYLDLVKSNDFTAADEGHIRKALLDATKLMEDGAQLIADSVLGEESAVDAQRLIKQAERCGIKVTVGKETTFADQVQTETSFQVQDNRQPAGEKMETLV
ncbi:MAG: hypothetical protein OXC81_01955 [Betaproteobacteria bacterium]|nr:hypothetical protein [Betaproteobacteria bacterium]